MAYPDLAGAVVWSTCNGGSPPGAGDTLYLNSTAVLTLDGADASTYTCVAIKAATSAAPTTYNQNGYIVLGNATSTIAANLFAGTADLISLTAAANRTYTCTGTMTGGSASNIRAMYVNGGTHTLTFNNMTAGSSTNCAALRIDSGTIALAISGTCTGGTNAMGVWLVSGTITIATAIGAAVGGSMYNPIGAGVYSQATVTATVTTATGGSNNSPGLYVINAGTFTVTTAKGGTSIGAFGVLVGYGPTCIINGVDLTGTGYPVGTAGGTVKVAAGVPLRFSDAAGALKTFCPVPALGTVAKDVVLCSGGASYIGTRTDADKADVKAGVKYGNPDSQLTGELVAGGGVRRGGALRGA